MRKYRMNAAAINAAFIGDVLNPHLHKPVLTEKVDFDYFPEEHIDPVAEATEREATQCPVCHEHNGHSLSCPTLGVTPVLELQANAGQRLTARREVCQPHHWVVRDEHGVQIDRDKYGNDLRDKYRAPEYDLKFING